MFIHVQGWAKFHTVLTNDGGTRQAADESEANFHSIIIWPILTIIYRNYRPMFSLI